jgi:hypothetical protein
MSKSIRNNIFTGVEAVEFNFFSGLLEWMEVEWSKL